MLAYRSNFCRSVTATLRGASGRGIVVVGPLKHASAASSSDMVLSGMYDGSREPDLSHCSEPASHSIISDSSPQPRSMPSMESTISGPIPSPRMTAALPATAPGPPALHITRGPRDEFNARSGRPGRVRGSPSLARAWDC